MGRRHPPGWGEVAVPGKVMPIVTILRRDRRRQSGAELTALAEKSPGTTVSGDLRRAPARARMPRSTGVRRLCFSITSRGIGPTRQA